MKIRILSGSDTGAVRDVPQTEAENAVSTGYAELVVEKTKAEERAEAKAAAKAEEAAKEAEEARAEEAKKAARAEAKAAAKRIEDNRRRR